MTTLLVIGCSSKGGESSGDASTTTAQGAAGQGGAPGGPGGPGRGGAFGTIASIDGSTLTVNSTGFDGNSQDREGHHVGVDHRDRDQVRRGQ